MAAWLGSYGTAAFGEKDLPQAGAVIMQYTGHSEYSESDPPTYACVGENDGIANWRTMEARLNRLNELGIPTEFLITRDFATASVSERERLRRVG